METLLLIAASLLCFASNSILCRLALASHSIDAYPFTLLRLASGAVVLNLILAFRNRGVFRFTGRPVSAIALLVYALLFSLAYLRLAASTGALILFGSVQITMIGWSLRKGAGPTPSEWVGLLVALSGLLFLLFPGIRAPDPLGALCMACAGIGWGAYSILGKGAKNPLSDSSGNFLVATAVCLPVVLFFLHGLHLTARGVEWALLSGAVTSGIGYAIWYKVLPTIKSSQAAIVQLLVPAIAALLAVVLLDETITWRLAVSGSIIALGVLVATFKPWKRAA
jgi:drug/metabolite transporter (DMT)-like permease